MFYCCENEPGRGIAKGEDPTGEDDATCSGQCADVLKTGGKKVNFSKKLSIVNFNFSLSRCPITINKYKDRESCKDIS